MYKLFYLLLVSLLFINCKNDDDASQDPVDQLPPATQTGAQTFGCLINGEPFVPPSFGSDSPRAFYQFVRGAYTFSISGRKYINDDLIYIGIAGVDILQLQETEYMLLENESGNHSGLYFVNGGLISAATSAQHPGTLTITNFDEENFIISGTFSFTVFDDEGNEINITEGRFDMNYTN